MRSGGFLVGAMPKLLAALSVIGIAAMLWVGGHIRARWSRQARVGCALGLVHGLAHATASVPVTGEVLEWVVETACSAVLGFAVGAVIVAVVHLIPKRATEAAR